MRPLFSILLLLSGTLISPLAAQTSSNPKLVPAAFTPKTDALGFVWDVDQQGAVSQGTNNCFSNGFQMEVNNNTFNPTQSLMTADGSEYVLTGNVSNGNSNVEVTRRIRVDVKNSTIRYLDTVRNTGASAAQTTLQINATLNNRVQAIISDQGSASGATLGPKESGLLAIRNANQQQPAIVFYLADAAAKVKPTVRNNSNYRLDFTYSLSLNAGDAVSVVYGAGQRTQATVPDPKGLAALFAPFKSARFTAGISGKERKTIINLGPGSALLAGGGDTPALATPLDRLNVERGPSDVLAIGEETRLRGSASCKALTVAGEFGPVQVPLEKVAAIRGGPQEGYLYLRDGQALGGRITADELKFTVSTGTAIPLNIGGLARLVMRTGTRADDAPVAGVWGWVETFGGDRLAVVVPDAAFRVRVITPYGPREIAPDDLLWMAPASEENTLGYRVVLKDGSRFFALLDGDELEVKTALFGVRKIPAGELRALVSAQPRPKTDEDADKPDRAQTALAGDQLLSGSIDLAELHFVTAGDAVPISPATIKTLHNTADEKNPAAGFVAEIWGGGTVAGALRETVLPVRTGDVVQMVPTQDLLEATLPAPAVSDNLRDKIANLIRDLGHPEWEKREAASRDLGELGAMPRTQLAEAVKQTTDAEVRRRAQSLLDEAQ